MVMFLFKIKKFQFVNCNSIFLFIYCTHVSAQSDMHDNELGIRK